MGAIDRDHYNQSRRLIEVRFDDNLMLVSGTDGHRLHRWTSPAATGSQYQNGLYLIREDTQKRIKLATPEDWQRQEFPDVDSILGGPEGDYYKSDERNHVVAFQQKFSYGDAGEYTLIAKLLRAMENSCLTVEYITELYRRGSAAVEGEWDITLVNELEKEEKRWTCNKPVFLHSPDLVLQALVMPRRP
jgi:hypothetical protein